MLAVIVTPRPQPVFKPTYRFETDITPPISMPVTIDRTLSWLIRQQRADGYLGGKATHFEQMYCHAMTTYALAEAYGMQSDLSSDRRLREPLMRAVN